MLIPERVGTSFQKCVDDQILLAFVIGQNKQKQRFYKQVFKYYLIVWRLTYEENINTERLVAKLTNNC